MLAAEGKNPTIENIRLITGTGSSTTIAHHLQSWKENRERERATDKEEIPSEMTATVKGLWERMVNMASDKVTEVKQNLEQAIIELQEETIRLK